MLRLVTSLEGGKSLLIRFGAFGWLLTISLRRRAGRSPSSPVGDRVRSKGGFLVRDDQQQQTTAARTAAAQRLE